MVTDTRSDGAWQPVEYDGYDPLPIVDLKVHMLGVDEAGRRDGLLRVITEDGIEGWCNLIDPELARVITGPFREHLIGRDALAHERLWHDLLMLERLKWPPKKLRGAIDVALWDIAGKRCGLPVWRLLGACRDKVPTYRTQESAFGPEGKSMDHFLEFALQSKEMGYLGSKDHCYGGPKFMIELAGRLRDAVGPDFHLMHDAVGYYDHKEAVRVGRALAEHDYTWFEEPLRDHDFLGLVQLRRTLEIPVVAGEYFPHHLHSYAQMLALGAADGIKPHIEMGGITEMFKLAQLSYTFGVDMHVGAGLPMWGFSSLHVSGAIENAALLEVVPFEHMAPPALKNPLKLSGGYIEMPEGPGLGVDLDMGIIESETTEVIQ